MLSAKKKPPGSLGCFDFHLKKTSKFCWNCCIRSHLFGISWHRLHLCPALLLFLLPRVRLRPFSSRLVTEADWLVGERKLTASGICWNFMTDLKTLLIGGWQAGVLRAHLKIWEIQPPALSNAVNFSPITHTYFFFSHISKTFCVLLPGWVICDLIRMYDAKKILPYSHFWCKRLKFSKSKLVPSKLVM